MTAEQSNVPSPAPAGEALVQQIAEALRGWWHQPPGAETFWVEAARAVLPLVEAQVAPLRDERDSIFGKAIEFKRKYIEAKARADAAESALRQVRELAEEWESATFWDRAFGSRLRAVLDSARVGAADTQPEGASEGCDCTELCSMGPTCPGGILAGLPDSGCRICHHAAEYHAPNVPGCAECKCRQYRPPTPTAGGKVDTAPEACRCQSGEPWHDDDCEGCTRSPYQPHRHVIEGHRRSPADTAPESGEGR